MSTLVYMKNELHSTIWHVCKIFMCVKYLNLWEWSWLISWHENMRTKQTKVSYRMFFFKFLRNFSFIFALFVVSCLFSPRDVLCTLNYAYSKNMNHDYSLVLKWGFASQIPAPIHFLWCDLVTFHAYKYTIITIAICSMKHVFSRHKFYYKWK